MKPEPNSAIVVAAAVCLSFFESVKNFGVLAASRMAFNMVCDVLEAIMFKRCRSGRLERVDRKLACLRCAYFCRKYGTCGRPGAVDHVDGEKIGCWCHYRIAAFVKRKRCWAGERFGESEDRWK